MKLSLNWLRELVDVDLPPAELARRITDATAEVEGFEVLLALHASVTRQLSPTLLAKAQQMSSAGVTGVVPPPPPPPPQATRTTAAKAPSQTRVRCDILKIPQPVVPNRAWQLGLRCPLTQR